MSERALPSQVSVIVRDWLDSNQFVLADRDHVAVYRECNEEYLGLAPRTLARRLVGELERSGAIERIDGDIVPGSA